MSNLYTQKIEAMAESVKDSAVVQQIAWEMLVDTINNLQKQYNL